MNFGVVGYGLIGKKRAKAIKEKNEILSFVVDPNHQPGDIFYKSYNDLPINILESLDGVVISVPHFLIIDAVKFFSKYVKNLLVEKPLGLNLTECKEIIKLEEKERLSIKTGFNYRYLKNVEKLKELILQDYFGEIFQIDMRLEHGGRPGMENEWKLNKSKAGGGVVIDPGVHLFDLINYLFSSDINVDFVKSSTKFWNVDVEDSLSCILNVDKITANISVNLYSWVNSFSIRVYGKHGFANLSGRGGNYGPLKIEAYKRWSWQTGEEPISFDYGEEDDSFSRETYDFINNPNCNKISNTSDALNAMKIVDSIYGQ